MTVALEEIEATEKALLGLEKCKKIIGSLDLEADALNPVTIEAFIILVPKTLENTANNSAHKIIREYCNKVRLILSDPSRLPSDNLVALLRSLGQHLKLWREYPVLRKQLVKDLISLWSSWPSDEVRIVSLLAIFHLCSRYTTLLEPARKLIYQHYGKSCKSLSVHNLGQATLMLNGVLEMFTLQPAKGAEYGQKCLRQLAKTLQQAIKSPDKEHGRMVLNWTIVAQVRLWSRLLSTQIEKDPNSPYSKLLFPFCGILASLMNYQMAPRYFAFHFHCVEAAMELVKSLQTGLPIASCLLKIITYVAKQPLHKLETKKASYDLVAMIKVPKSETMTKGYLETVAEDACCYLIKYLAILSSSPTLPEYINPIFVAIRSILATPKIDGTFKKQLQSHVSKLIQQKNETEAFRSKESITPAALASGPLKRLIVPEELRPLVAYSASLEKVRLAKKEILSSKDEEEDKKLDKSKKTVKQASTKLGLPATEKVAKKKRPLPESKLRSSKKTKKSGERATNPDEDIVEDFIIEDD